MKITELKFKIERFEKFLSREQKSRATIKAYLRSAAVFFIFIAGISEKKLNDKLLLDFKEYLIKIYASSSANLYITGFNAFLNFINYNGIRIKCIKRQGNECVANPLTKIEFNRLCNAAGRKDDNT